MYFHCIELPILDKDTNLLQIWEVVLREVLNLNEPAGESPCPVGTVELDQPSGPAVRADHLLHGGVFLDTALRQLLPKGESLFDHTFSMGAEIGNSGFGFTNGPGRM